MLACLALPAAASANPLDIPSVVPAQFRAPVRQHLHMPAPHEQFESRLELQDQHGYHLAVTGEGDVVAVVVTRPFKRKNPLEFIFGPDQAVTTYVARGTVTPFRIAASFGKLGKIDVRFKPSGRLTHTPRRRHCRGADRFTDRPGTFVGSVRFTGEKHYVSVRAHRAKGRVRTPLGLDCGGFFRARAAAGALGRPVQQHPSFTPTFLTATARHGVSSTELLALKAKKLALLLAVREESHGSIAAIRYAVVVEKPKILSTDDALTRATLDPSAPFHGKGSYQAAPDGTVTWTGPLTVALPGMPRLPLTGEQFETTVGAGF